MEKIAREQAEPRTDTLVWGKNAVTDLLKSGGAVDTVYLADSLPQPRPKAKRRSLCCAMG